jgi:hypothetical protein
VIKRRTPERRRGSERDPIRKRRRISLRSFKVLELINREEVGVRAPLLDERVKPV